MQNGRIEETATTQKGDNRVLQMQYMIKQQSTNNLQHQSWIIPKTALDGKFQCTNRSEGNGKKAYRNNNDNNNITIDERSK